MREGPSCLGLNMTPFGRIEPRVLQVAPMETVSVVYRLVPIVPGHVLLPKVAVVPEREQVRPVEEAPAMSALHPAAS